jgi:hypothetical protein
MCTTNGSRWLRHKTDQATFFQLLLQKEKSYVYALTEPEPLFSVLTACRHNRDPFLKFRETLQVETSALTMPCPFTGLSVTKICLEFGMISCRKMTRLPQCLASLRNGPSTFKVIGANTGCGRCLSMSQLGRAYDAKVL